MSVSKWGCFGAWVCLGVVWGVPSGLAGPPGPAEQARYADLDARAIHTFTNADLADYLSLRR